MMELNIGVRKRNGRVVEFNHTNIYKAVSRALKETEGVDILDLPDKVVEDVVHELEDRQGDDSVVDIEEIQDLVEFSLMKHSPTVAKKYVLYREKRARLREEGWAMNDLQRDIYEKKYRMANESFGDFVKRVSGGIRSIQKAIIDKKFMPAGRILAGRGVYEATGRKVVLSNCFVLPLEDSVEGIFNTARDMAKTYARGGGVGLNVSPLRPKGSTVHNAAETTSGAVSFMELFSHVTKLIGGSGRRGALMLNMDISHPDIIDFINVKNNLSAVTGANISVNLTDEFLEAVKEDKDYTLKFTDHPRGEQIEKTVKARDLMMMIAKSAWRTGEPGILFWDRIEQNHLLSHDGSFKLAGVNPCVTGDTKILTDKGYVAIEDTIGESVRIWNGFQWSEVTPRITGRDQDVLLVRFSDGKELKCTPYHEFILKDGSRVKAKDLQIGDKLQKFFMPLIIDGDLLPEKTAYTYGFFAGDGYKNNKTGRAVIHLYSEEKKALLDKLEYQSFSTQEHRNRMNVNLTKTMKGWDKFRVPTEFAPETRLAWLSGLIDADGTKNSSEGSIGIHSSNLEFLREVGELLNTLGVNSTISLSVGGGEKMMPSSDRTVLKEYITKPVFRITISAFDTKRLIDLGLKLHRVNVNPRPNRDASRFIRVESVEYSHKADKVFCFTEPFNHTGVFNGVMTGQCGEQPLPAGGSCNLASINLSEFVDNPFTDKASFNFDEFNLLVVSGVNYLNDIIDENISLLPLDIQKENAKRYREVGLGIMGLADMFIKMGIKYGSEESLKLCDQIGTTMANTAIWVSSLMARADGTFPAYNKEAVLKSEFLRNNTTDNVFKFVEENGLRNRQLLTIAPTGSISTLIGVSNGIEPIFRVAYQRKTESLHGEDTYYQVVTEVVKDLMKAKGIEDIKDLPDYVVTADQIPYEERLAVQGMWQKHIDASISSTLNLPNETTVDEVYDILMKSYDYGVKGITIFRDGCEREGILTTGKSKEQELQDLQQKVDEKINEMLIENPNVCPMCGGEMIHSGGCGECQDCGYSPCSI
jgi:ribonucleotide reductase alpha subunit